MTSQTRAIPWRGTATGAGALAALGWGALALVLAIALGGRALVAGPALNGTEQVQDPPSALARRDIPSEYMRLYLGAARTYGLDWATIAAIGKVECDHGRAMDASCRRIGATNAAGAGGPMQFLASTWAAYGRDANGDGSASRWDAADAIYAAAAYLTASGARRDVGSAILAYNHATWYVALVERWASRYRSGLSEAAEAASETLAAGTLAEGTRAPVEFIEGGRARLAPGEPHVALIPAAAPPAVQAMVVAGNELQDLPYGPAGHPNPLGAPQEDCSSTVSYVLYRAGVRPLAEILRANPLAQSYVRWGASGPGRWVSIYATDAPSAHVFMVIAGLRLDTSHNGTDFGPNSHEDGPRWRIFDGIPAWAHWSIRHPPGM